MSRESEILTTARKRYKYAVDAMQQNRVYQLDDMKFAAGSPDNGWQWPEDVKAARAAKPDQAARATLTINKLPQHIRLVTNEQRQNRPSIKVLPVDDKGDVEVAEVLNGIIRHIEAQSDAGVAYDTAAENQVMVGEGFFRILTEFCDEKSFDQDVVIAAIKNPFCVYLDPDGLIKDSTGQQCEWGFITDEMSDDEFQRMFPNAKARGDWEQGSPGDEFADWWLDGRVRIAEYFYAKYTEKKILRWPDGRVSVEGEPLPEGIVIGMVPLKTRSSKFRSVHWCKTNGFELLEEKDWAGKYIPIVRIVGNEFYIEGKMVVSGIVRNAKDAQRMVNYWTSQEAELLALAPKSPFVAAIEAIQGYEDRWDTANQVNYSYLPYNAFNEAGEAIPAPARQMPPLPPAGIVNAKLGASDDLQSAVGQYNPSIGADASEKSGKAIMARQRQADVGTFHYMDNEARGIRYAGRIVLDLIPKIYDTKRIARTIGMDGTPDKATIDTTLTVPFIERKDEFGAIEKIYNPGLGRYDVEVSTGPSYTTKRQEAAEFMAQVLQGNRELMPMIGDLFFKMLDVPGADELAERMKKMLPPGIGDDEDAEQEPMVQTPQGPVPASQAGQVIAQMGEQLMAAEEAVKKAGNIEMAEANLERQMDAVQSARELLTLRQQASATITALQEKLAMQGIDAERDALESDKKLAEVELKRLDDAIKARIREMNMVETDLHDAASEANRAVTDAEKAQQAAAQPQKGEAA